MSNNDDKFRPKTAEQLRDENFARLLMTTEERLAKQRIAAVYISEDHQGPFRLACAKLNWTLVEMKNAWIVEV